MAEAFDPYYKWLGIPPSEQPPNHYRLLAIKLFESDPDVIDAAADGRMVHLRSYQTSKNGASAQRLLNEVSAARVALLNPQTRAAYDEQLRARLSELEPLEPALDAVLPPGSVMPASALPYPAPLPPGNAFPPQAPTYAPQAAAPAPAPFISNAPYASAYPRRKGNSLLLFAGVGIVAVLTLGTVVIALLAMQKKEQANTTIANVPSTNPGPPAPIAPPTAPGGAKEVPNVNSTVPTPPGNGNLTPQPGATSGANNSSPSAGSAAQVATSRVVATGADGEARSPILVTSRPRAIYWSGHEGPVLSVAFAGDGKTAASGGEDRTVRIWDVATDRQIKLFEGLPEQIEEVRLSHDGQLVAAAMPRAKLISVWKINNPGQAFEFRPSGDFEHFDLSRDGRLVIVGGTGFVEVYNAQNGSRVQAKQADAFDVALSADGRYFAYGGPDRLVHVCQVEDGEEMAALQGHTDDVRALAFADNGPLLASSGPERRVRVWNLETQKLVATFETANEPISDLALSADGRRAVTRGDTVRGWNVVVGSGALHHNQNRLSEPDISPNGEFLLVGEPRGTVGIIRLPPLNNLATVPRDADLVVDVPAVAAPTIEKQPVPDEQEVNTRQTSLRDTFDALISGSPEQRITVVKNLLYQATNPSASPAERYAMLTLAATIARETGDARLMLQAIDEADKRFVVDAIPWKLKELGHLADEARDEATVDSLIANVGPVFDEAVAAGMVLPAASLLDNVDDLAAKSQGKRHSKTINELKTEFAKTRRLWTAAQTAQDKLKVNADHPESNLAVGRWKCLQLAQWEEGLPFLAKGSDEPLAKAAAQDIQTARGSVEQQLAVADAWFDASQRGALLDKPALLHRAGHWYRKALPDLTDEAKKARAEERLAHIDTIPAPWAPVEPSGPLPPGKWVYVLGAVDVQRDVVDGSWRQLREAVLSTETDREVKFELPVVIKGSYEFEFDFTAQDAHLTAYLPVGEKGCQLWLGQWGGEVSGLGWIDGKDPLGNPTKTRADIRKAVRYRMLVRVEQKGDEVAITVQKDGKPYLQWKGPHAQLDGTIRNAIRDPHKLGLGSSKSAALFHTARVRLLSGEAKLADAPTTSGGFAVPR